MSHGMPVKMGGCLRKGDRIAPASTAPADQRCHGARGLPHRGRHRGPVADHREAGRAQAEDWRGPGRGRRRPWPTRSPEYKVEASSRTRRTGRTASTPGSWSTGDRGRP
ncbi:hypothetical protein QJS66_02385 [Kocuria rhizophila]|nr:hypothetical protein QJS66_02385 [Kocuria rhizophila]